MTACPDHNTQMSRQNDEPVCICGARHFHCSYCGKVDCIQREMWYDLLSDYAHFKRTGEWPLQKR